ncbi:hypothetical protein JOQ06_027859, partial [Pogonophryne albipinna]
GGEASPGLGGGCSQSQSRFNWCQAGLGEKPSETGDTQRDRKPFIRGLPPTASLSVSLSVLLSLPISLPLKISHRRSVSICSLPLPLTLSWLQTFTIYHSSSHPGCSLCAPSCSASITVSYPQSSPPPVSWHRETLHVPADAQINSN